MTQSVLQRLETKHGPMLGFRADKYITGCLAAYGEFSPGEWKMLAQMVKPGMTVVEAGANIGAHTVPLARACAPGALYAFEPQQRVFQVLCANLVNNEVKNVVALPDAVGAEPGHAIVPDVAYGHEGNFGGVSLRAVGEVPGRRVRVSTIDDLELTSCGLIKVDVEGFERQVLRGARETIARCRPRLYVENDRREHQAELIMLIEELGYRQYWHLPALVDDAHQPNIFGGRIVSLNLVCVPKESGTQIDIPQIDPWDWTDPVTGLRTTTPREG
jgi:FkbM family methyltransferase